jgi:2-keto-4-pentenoate hydratase/2-oxohepta-3-ene-1,7-dioic acid hydratase in catechol pathway
VYLARFAFRDEVSYGIVQDLDSAADGAAAVSPAGGPERGDARGKVIRGIGGDPLYTEVAPSDVVHPLEAVRLLAPVIPRSKVVVVAPDGVWLKPNTAVVGPGDPIVLPRGRALAWPALAVVVSRICKDVPAAQAAEVILGCAVATDVVLGRGEDVLRPDRSAWGSARDTFCPLGPWIDTDADGQAELTAQVDERTVVRAECDLSAGALGALVALASGVATLLPGDVILAPARVEGVEFDEGDVLTSAVSGIGVLSNLAVRREG